MFTFAPSGLDFAVPATVSFPVAAREAQPTVYWSSVEGTGYDALPTTVANGVASAEVTHFSSGFVGFPPGCRDGACGTAAISATPAVAEFGEYDDSALADLTKVWAVYQALTIRISNRGDAPATLGGIGFSNDQRGVTHPVFYIGPSETLPAGLAPGASTSFTVGFYTAASGCYTGGVSFVADGRVNELPVSGWRIVAPLTLGDPVTLPRGGTFTAVPRDRDGGIVSGCARTWTSANPEIATVSADGTVTGLSPGSTQITVSIHGYTAAVSVSVPCGSDPLLPGNACCDDGTQGASCCGSTALTSDSQCCADGTQAAVCSNRGTGTWTYTRSSDTCGISDAAPASFTAVISSSAVLYNGSVQLPGGWLTPTGFDLPGETLAPVDRCPLRTLSLHCEAPASGAGACSGTYDDALHDGPPEGDPPNPTWRCFTGCAVTYSGQRSP